VSGPAGRGSAVPMDADAVFDWLIFAVVLAWLVICAIV
jgi:hypothetical protein